MRIPIHTKQFRITAVLPVRERTGKSVVAAVGRKEIRKVDLDCGNRNGFFSFRGNVLPQNCELRILRSLF